MARYALIIGITEYQSPHLSRLPKAATDAEIVAQVLEQYGDFQVKRLPESWTPDKKRKVGQKKLTGAELGQELETLLLKQATGSEALIYFAGHGFTIADNLGEQQGFLATSDCQIEMVGKEAVEQKYGISIESLNRLIGKSDLSSLVMLLDCCHSGYFLERNLIQQTLTTFSAQKDYYLITASRSYEHAYSFEGEPHAIFTGAVLKGLAAENAGSNRGVTGDRLFDFISAELKNSVQEPIRMGWGRSITLVTYPNQEQTTAEVTFNRENPYLGLSAFESDRQKYFFGREQAVRALLDRLNNNRFLAVIGPSGCGKSSVVKAGLLPQLQSDRLPGSSQWEVESFTPGKHPLGTLIEILERGNRQDKPFVLFIDQFEEVFTLCDSETERQSFIKLMADEAATSERVTRVIATIRGDFLDRCAEYPEAVHLINRAQPTTYVVTPLSRRELEEAIEKPATLHGVKFEGGLVSQIVEDVKNQPGALPLLQYALSELWRVFCLQDSSSEPLLTWKDYEKIGGVKGALNNRSTLLYRSLSTDNQAFVRRLFMELVQVSEGQEVTRRRATWEELETVTDSPEQLQQVVGLLADQQQRLIITDANTVEVAHEALLSEWTLLRSWIEENRESLRLRRRLEAECREWQEKYHKSDEALLTGARLAAIAEWVEKTQPKLLPLEEEFLRKSLEKRDREIKAELEQERQLREAAEARAIAQAEKAKAEKQRTQLAIGAGVVGVVLVTFFGLIQIQFAKISEANTLIASAETFKRNNYQLEALMECVKALNLLRQVYLDKRDLLEKIQTLIYGVQERNRLEYHTAEVFGVSFRPDGKMIASGSGRADKTIKIWSTEGKLLKTLPGHKDGTWSVRYSRKGKVLASTGLDGTVKIWNAETAELQHTFRGHQKGEEGAYDISFSPGDSLLASSGRDGAVRIWRIDKGQEQEIADLDATEFVQGEYKNRGFYRVFGVDFHPKKKEKIAYAGDLDGSVKIWDWQSKNPPKLIGKHENTFITLVRFSPDGAWLASSGRDGTIKIWRTEDGALIGEIKGHKKSVYGLAFHPNPNTKIMASASEDETIKVWQIDKVIESFNANRKPLEDASVTLQGHTASLNRLEFSPDGQFIVSGSDDRTVRIWQWQTNSNIKETAQLKKLLDESCNALRNYLDNSKNISQKYRIICPKLASH
jgi:WD40 repeat protein/energy-coupling factor transporter ATP-binding protein EcfA2